MKGTSLPTMRGYFSEQPRSNPIEDIPNEMLRNFFLKKRSIRFGRASPGPKSRGVAKSSIGNQGAPSLRQLESCN